MPEAMTSAIAFLVLGYVLCLAEIVVPGAVLGILGTISVLYGVYEAFLLGPLWGVLSIVASVVVFAGIARLFLHSKSGLVLDHDKPGGPSDWHSNRPDSGLLLGTAGTAASDLRPAGIGIFGEQRLDVVSDSAFIAAGSEIEVVEVEGRRIVVSPVGGWGQAEPEAPRDADRASDAQTSEPVTEEGTEPVTEPGPDPGTPP